jgi:hypothetical protein
VAVPIIHELLFDDDGHLKPALPYQLQHDRVLFRLDCILRCDQPMQRHAAPLALNVDAHRAVDGDYLA